MPSKQTNAFISEVNDIKTLEVLIQKVKQAQKIFEEYPQEKVDAIFKAAAAAANKARIPLAKMAVEDTGMGVVDGTYIISRTSKIRFKCFFSNFGDTYHRIILTVHPFI